MTPAGRDRLANLVLGAGPATATALVAGIVLHVATRGAGIVDWEFLVEGPTAAGREGGIGPMIVATAWVLVIGIGAALPLGLCAGTWLAEFAGPARTLRGALDVLSAVPSIVFGLFGMAFFCETLGMGWSLLSGGLTIAVMILPLFVRLTEAGLRAVSDDYRAAGAALGLPRWMLLRNVLLPEATPALAAALLLASGRVLSESAVLLFTAGASTRMPSGPMSPGRVLALHVYQMAIEVPGGEPRATATSLVLLGAILATTSLARLAPALITRLAR